jgi:hypothetical protein
LVCAGRIAATVIVCSTTACFFLWCRANTDVVEASKNNKLNMQYLHIELMNGILKQSFMDM